MDQLKDILKQAIKYRFWIAVGISAILPIVAYVLGSEPIKKKAADETTAIKNAESGVKKYANGVLPNAQYKPLVVDETNVLTQDVNASWKKLYGQQAPLLTWPATVEERFQTWGRKWPEDVDASSVQLAIIDYVTAYPKYVTQVYQTFHPFDPAEGTGVVSAPSEAALLKPAPFKIENPPELSKVWSAQERLWIQRTLLQVIADVNGSAKDWDSAIIKQINTLAVGNADAQDQISLTKNETLEEAPALVAPGAPPPTPTDPTAGASSGTSGGAAEEVQGVFYLKSDSTQYKILPVSMSVLIDQNHIQDLLIALENSPMAIQVTEFDMSKPPTRVTKPQKGETSNFSDMYAMYGGGPRMGRMGGMTGFGGMGMMPNGGMMIPRGEFSGMGGGGPADVVRKGINARDRDRAALLKKQRETKSVAHTIHDPYYYVVQVTVYGQARFYNPPPPDATPAPSTTERAAAPGAEAKAEGDAAKADAAKAQEAPKAEGEMPKGKDEPAKAEGEAAKKDEAKAEGEATKKDEAAKKGEATKKDEAAKEKAEPEAAKKAEPETPKKAEDATPKAGAETPKAKDEPAKPASPSAKS